MSIFDKLKNGFKKVTKMDSEKNINAALSISSAVSEKMDSAIKLWAELYENSVENSLNLPCAIAAEIARCTTIEMKVDITGGVRAKFLNEQIMPVLADIRRQSEYACAKGGLVFKPFVRGNKIVVDYIQADAFMPTDFDGGGRITGAVFTDKFSENGKFFTRAEYHRLTPEGYVISNSAYESEKEDDLGKQISLASVSAWANLAPEITIKGATRPLFAYFKMPFANTIDTGSPLGVSVYSRAVNLIKQADRQYSRLLWEFESGERAIFVSEGALKKDQNGEVKLPDVRLYRALGFDDDNEFKDWSPTLREKSLLNGLDSILMKIEDACSLSRGTISSPQTEAKTATELKILRQRSYANIADTQKALKCAFEDLIYAMDVWADIASLAPSGAYEAAFEFDDSIISDRQAEFKEKCELTEMSIMQPWELRMWYFGETEQKAKQMLNRPEHGIKRL